MLTDRAVNKLKRMQSGSGRKNIKRRKRSLKNHSIANNKQVGKGRKTLKKKKSSGKKTYKRSTKKSRFVDIFDN